MDGETGGRETLGGAVGLWEVTMLRIRFHGRGGQGVKTAGQILGTAGFLSGLRAQDFPLYGAERRGAPIVASTRLGTDLILERGAILCPDLVLIGDETLIEDKAASPLAGTDTHSRFFINSHHSPIHLQNHYKLPSLPVAMDLTEFCLRHLDRATVLSSALAAAAARMTGRVDISTLFNAIKIELEQLGLGENVVHKNVDLAAEVYTAFSPEVPEERAEELLSEGVAPLAEMGQEDLPRAAPLILAESNMGLRKTGNWRVFRPDIDYEQCNACWICFARCPEGTISIRFDDQMPVIDYDHCKGCMICAEECPKHAIKINREVASWA